MSPLELSADAQRIIAKVQKLLAIANDERGNEHQAAAAAAKAQELLEAYNLSMVQLDAGKVARQDMKTKGGLYQWQRDLWSACARLNFCYYWTVKGTYKGQTFQHRIVGRQENVVGTEVLASYLQQTVERLAQDEARARGENVFCRAMIAYREGMASRLYERLNQRRNEKLEEERRQQAARQAAQQAPAGDGNGTSLVLSTLVQTEDDLNTDFMWGYEPGTTARRRMEREARQREAMAGYERQMVERKAWLAAHPEEAAKIRARQEAEERKQAARDRRNARRREQNGGGYRYRRMTAAEERQNSEEYFEGWERGRDISLDSQVDKGRNQKRIG